MRKIVITAVALLTLGVVAATALAVNQYALTNASTSPKGKGTPSNPISKQVNFDYLVRDSEGPRGSPVVKYKIAVQGVTAKWAAKFPRCRFSEAAQDAPRAVVLQKCGKAVVGGGRVETLVSDGVPSPDDPNDVDYYCNLQLTLINVVGGLAIRLDADQTTPLPQSQTDKFGCVAPTHRAIFGKLRAKRIGGVPTNSLEFSVPLELRHIAGLTITVARTKSTVIRKVKRLNVDGDPAKETVGFFTAIGCGKRKRLTVVTFVDERGDVSRKRKASRC